MSHDEAPNEPADLKELKRNPKVKTFLEKADAAVSLCKETDENVPANELMDPKAFVACEENLQGAIKSYMELPRQYKSEYRILKLLEEVLELDCRFQDAYNDDNCARKRKEMRPGSHHSTNRRRRDSSIDDENERLDVENANAEFMSLAKRARKAFFLKEAFRDPKKCLPMMQHFQVMDLIDDAIVMYKKTKPDDFDSDRTVNPETLVSELEKFRLMLNAVHVDDLSPRAKGPEE